MADLTPEMQQALSQLRDIHLPDPVGWWPLAPGWWALVGLIVLTLIGVLTARMLYRRSLRFAALCELSRIRAQADAADGQWVATELSVLLRRVALRRRGGIAAPLAGPAWAAFLREGPCGLDHQIADWLAEAPYAGPGMPTPVPPARLITAAEQWIRKAA